MGNGRQNHKFSCPKNRGGILLYCAGADGNTCGQKSRGDEKQLIDLEWPYSNKDSKFYMTTYMHCQLSTVINKPIIHFGKQQNHNKTDYTITSS